MVVAKAVEAAGLLATGLRTDFAAGAKSMTDAMLQKLKEKKGFVLAAIHTALDAFFAVCFCPLACCSFYVLTTVLVLLLPLRCRR